MRDGSNTKGPECSEVLWLLLENNYNSHSPVWGFNTPISSFFTLPLNLQILQLWIKNCAFCLPQGRCG